MVLLSNGGAKGIAAMRCSPLVKYEQVSLLIAVLVVLWVLLAGCSEESSNVSSSSENRAGESSSENQAGRTPEGQAVQATEEQSEENPTKKLKENQVGIPKPKEEENPVKNLPEAREKKENPPPASSEGN